MMTDTNNATPIRNAKRTVERKLEKLKTRLITDPGCFKIELQMQIAHLEAALKYWIDGISEYQWII